MGIDVLKSEIHSHELPLTDMHGNFTSFLVGNHFVTWIKEALTSWAFQALEIIRIAYSGIHVCPQRARK